MLKPAFGGLEPSERRASRVFRRGGDFADPRRRGETPDDGGRNPGLVGQTPDNCLVGVSAQFGLTL